MLWTSIMFICLVNFVFFSWHWPNCKLTYWWWIEDSSEDRKAAKTVSFVDDLDSVESEVDFSNDFTSSVWPGDICELRRYYIMEKCRGSCQLQEITQQLINLTQGNMKLIDITESWIGCKIHLRREIEKKTSHRTLPIHANHGINWCTCIVFFGLLYRYMKHSAGCNQHWGLCSASQLWGIWLVRGDVSYSIYVIYTVFYLFFCEQQAGISNAGVLKY